MKKLPLVILCFLCCFLSHTLLAQSYTFRVLAHKGLNKYKKGKTGEIILLKTGATLNLEDELMANENAYIGLMHNSGNTMEVKKPGNYLVADLAKQISVGSSSIASRYAEYVSNKMNEQGNKNYKSRLHAMGVVSRSMENASLNVMLPKTVDVVSNEVIVDWENLNENATYIVTIKDIFDKVIYKNETNISSLKLNFDQLNSDTGLYILNVRDKFDSSISSGDIGIKRNLEENENIIQEFAQLQTEIPEKSPLEKIIYASYFEEKGLYLDAMTQYNEAIEWAPEVEDFKEIYRNFLLKNNLSNK